MTNLSLFRDQLLAQGFRLVVQDDYPAFDFEGGRYVVHIGDDPGFVRVLRPNFCVLDASVDAARAWAACSHANAVVKTFKMFAHSPPDRAAGALAVSAGVDLRFERVEDFAALLPRSLRALQVGCAHFRDLMQPKPSWMDQMKRAFGASDAPTGS